MQSPHKYLYKAYYLLCTASFSMTNSVMSDEQKVRVPWKKAYNIILFLFIIYLGFRGYNFAMTQVYRGQEKSLQEDIANRDAEIKKADASADYATYVAGRKLLIQHTDTGWLDRLSHVIEIFTKLQSLGGGNVQFSDFKIDFDLISLRGTVPNLSYIYAKNGVIDQFVALDFIKNVAIKDYKKNGDLFEFTLTADISLNGTGSTP